MLILKYNDISYTCEKAYTEFTYYFSSRTEEVLFEADSENDSETATPPAQTEGVPSTENSKPVVQRQRSDASTSSDKFGKPKLFIAIVP